MEGLEVNISVSSMALGGPSCMYSWFVQNLVVINSIAVQMSLKTTTSWVQVPVLLLIPTSYCAS